MERTNGDLDLEGLVHFAREMTEQQQHELAKRAALSDDHPHAQSILYLLLAVSVVNRGYSLELPQ